MITLNHESRSQTEPLTGEELQNVIVAINCSLWDGQCPNPDNVMAIQKLINHYENLCHFKAVHEGLWATEHKDKVIDKENVLFQIKF